MGGTRKIATRTKKWSYKTNAKRMNDAKRKRKNENNIVQEDVSNAKRPRLVNDDHDDTILVLGENCDNMTSYHILDTLSQKDQSCAGAPDKTDSSTQEQEDGAYSLQTETWIPPDNDTKINIGRRIINVSYFLEKLTEISNHGPLDCGLSCLELVGEKLHGLSSKFTFICKMCNKHLTINSEGDNCLSINACAVAATVSIGCGHSQLEEFSSAMNLPLISQKTYQTNHKLLSDNWQLLAQESMDQAAEEEKRIAIAEGRVTKNGTPIIDVISDNVYGKRSYKKNYSALSGAAAIIGRKTGKILYLGVRNKYCYHCDRAEKKKTAAPEHFCSKNYSGPSTGMESEIIVEGFKTSLATHGLIYGRLISDGDSSTYSKILQARPYPDVTVEKIECRNHLLRNFCNKLQSLQLDTKYLKSQRKLLTTSRIMKIRYCIKKSIEKNKNDLDPEEENLFNDILLSHRHAFGDHSQCKTYFCNQTGTQEENDITNAFYLTSLWQRICLIVQGIASHARSLLHDVDSNVVERYHSIIAKYVGGKRINFSLKNSYQTRCIASAVSFNEKDTLSKLYKKITNQSPRGKLKMWEDRKKQRIGLSKRYAKKKRRLIYNQKGNDKNYGQECEKPDMPEEMLNKVKEDFLKNLKKSDQERAIIERKTVLQRANGEWLEMRRSLLTASNFSRVIKRRATTPCANLVKDIIYRKNLDNVESISHGQKNEKVALAQLALQENITIRPCGLFIDKELFFLGATPDGLVGEDGLVEIKCPLTASKMGLQLAIDQKKVNFWLKTKTGELVINKKHAWYFQIQGQLHVTQRKYCLFAVWENENEKLKTEIIQREDLMWEKEMKDKLTKFYFDCLLPEILDPRLSRNMKIREPYIIAKNNAGEIKETKDNDQSESKNKDDRQLRTVSKSNEKCEDQNKHLWRYVEENSNCYLAADDEEEELFDSQQLTASSHFLDFSKF